MVGRTSASQGTAVPSCWTAAQQRKGLTWDKMSQSVSCAWVRLPLWRCRRIRHDVNPAAILTKHKIPARHIPSAMTANPQSKIARLWPRLLQRGSAIRSAGTQNLGADVRKLACILYGRARLWNFPWGGAYSGRVLMLSRNGSVAKGDMETPRRLISKMFFLSLSTFATRHAKGWS